MTDLQAAMGVCQLSKINSMWRKRKKLYNNYVEAFKELPVFFQKQITYDFKHAYHLFVMVFDKNKTKKNRNNLIEFLRKKKIGSSVHYRSVTEMSNYKKLLNGKNTQVPVSHYVGKNTISLPLYPDLSLKDQNISISEVKIFLMRKKIIFRCDAGTISELGTGHLQRCITLSILLKKILFKKKRYSIPN